MSKDEAQLFVRIPESLKYLVDQADRTNKELVISALEAELGVSTEDSVAVVERRISRLESRLSDEKAELESRRDRLQNIRNELSRARDIKEQKQSNEGSYEEQLDSILNRMEDDADDLAHVPPEHAVLDDIRVEYDRPNDEIHLDLKELAAEQQRNLAVAAFKQPRWADDTDRRTPIASHWLDGDEEDDIKSGDDSNE